MITHTNSRKFITY